MYYAASGSGGGYGGAFLAGLLLDAPTQGHVVEEDRGDQRQHQDRGSVEEDLMERGGQPGPDRVQHVVEDGGALRPEGCRLGAAGGDRGRVEDRLRVAAAGDEAQSLRGQVERAQLLADLD